MKRILINEAGATVYVLDRGDPQVQGQACFTFEELEWARVVGRDASDPAETKAFWETLVEKKIAGGKTYSIFQDFPKREIPAGERVRVAHHYGEQIQLMFQESKRKKAGPA